MVTSVKLRENKRFYDRWDMVIRTFDGIETDHIVVTHFPYEIARQLAGETLPLEEPDSWDDYFKRQKRLKAGKAKREVQEELDKLDRTDKFDEMKGALERWEKAWNTLKMGHNSQSDVQKWITDELAPARLEGLDALNLPRPEGC